MKNRILALAAAAMLSFTGTLFTAPALAVAEDTSSVAAETENRYDKQDDQEVSYDKTKWVQPSDWGDAEIDLSEFKGGLILFFDKVGIPADYARGTVYRMYCSVFDVKEPVEMIRLHIFYDTRLKVQENSNGSVITPGRMFKGFLTGSSVIQEGELEFFAYSPDSQIEDGTLFTIDFLIPEDAQTGNLYPVGIEYVVDDDGNDLFINRAKDDAGKLQMAFLFNKGISSGYISILEERYGMGNVNADGYVDSSDASDILAEYARRQTGAVPSFDEHQTRAADVNGDSFVDSSDASDVLAYYAYTSTGGDLTIEEFLSAEQNE